MGPLKRNPADAAGHFPDTEAGNKFILVVIDFFSKWAEAYAFSNQEATTVAVAGGKPRVVHFKRLSPYAGDNGEEQVRELCAPATEMGFDDFMVTYSDTAQASFGVTS